MIFAAKIFPATKDNPEECVIYGGCSIEEWKPAIQYSNAVNHYQLATYSSNNMNNDNISKPCHQMPLELTKEEFITLNQIKPPVDANGRIYIYSRHSAESGILPLWKTPGNRQRKSALSGLTVRN